ncbi:MAG: TolC family outer membrane protein [Caedimonas sp.]|nr:TolC family outer membrane protein [Caedimonas sp.]
MTKFRVILSPSVAMVAIIMMAIVGKDLVANDFSATSNNQSRPVGNLPKKNVTNPPLWLKIDHAPLIHPKDAKEGMAANHPFNKALASAYNSNPQLKSSLRQYYAIAENLSQAMSRWRPSVGGQLTAGYSVNEKQNRGGSLTPPGTSSTNPKTATLNVTQNLYEGGKTVAGISGAENQVRSARADFLNTEQTILLNAVKAYLDVWFQREKLKTIKTSEQFYKENLEQTKAQAEVGESSTITDVAQAQFKYETAIASRIATETDLENAYATYIRVIGEEAPAVLPFPVPLHEIMELPKSLPDLLEAVKKYNPGIIKSEYDYAAAKDNVDVAFAALLPSVDLVGSADRTLSNTSRGVRQNDASVTLRLTVPIYNNGGADWSSVSQGEQTAAQKKYDVKTSLESAIQNAKQTWKNVLSNKDQIRRYEAAVKSGGIHIEGTRQEYIVGERSLLEVLQAEADLVDAQVNLLKERHDYILNGYALMATIGELTPETLQLAVDSYDLNTYPEAVRNRWIGWSKAPSDTRGKQ